MRRITPASGIRFGRRLLRRAVTRAGRVVTRVGVWLGGSPRHLPDEPFPAGFRRWTARRSFKLKGGFPDSWRMPVARYRARSRVAAVVHVFYPELLPEILAQLAHIPVPVDLIVTDATGTLTDADLATSGAIQQTLLLEVENHGRDILPLVQVVNAGLLDDYDLVMKVHTKRSPWREEHATLEGTGAAWRSGFFADLLESPDRIRRILGAFAANPDLGVLTSRGNVVGPEHWGGDTAITRSLLRRLQLEIADNDLVFAAGSIYWARGFVLQGLRALDLSAEDFEPEIGHIDGTTAHAIERAIGILAVEAGFEVRDTEALAEIEVAADDWRRFLPEHEPTPLARAVPFYLPQFHRFPENDAWWGTGFTEWSNVAAARPVYDGHNQPLLPGELGFYDLSQPAVTAAQADLARRMGLSGFMYYYYWFAGKTLMSGPVETIVDSDLDAPFCIMWANENWTRRWDGSAQNILIGQDYEQVPAVRFITDVMPLLTDPRYLRVDGKPVVAVYRISQIPDFPAVLERWRAEARRAGLPGLHLLSVDVGAVMEGIDDGDDPAAHGLDGLLEFAPHNMTWAPQSRLGVDVDDRFRGRMMSYRAMMTAALSKLRGGLADHRYPGLMVNFDNTARRQWEPDLWYGSNPYTFRRWLRSTVLAVADRDFDERLVFINAWNEWAESAVLEPSQRYGRTYLLATRSVLLP